MQKYKGVSGNTPPSSDFPDGVPPADMSEGTSDGSGGTPPDSDRANPPDSNVTPGDGNGGTPPEGSGMGGPRGLTLTGEEKTLAVDDSVKITKESMGQSSDASLDDIENGSILTIVMDEDNVVSIQIFDFGNAPKGVQEGASGTEKTI